MQYLDAAAPGLIVSALVGSLILWRNSAVMQQRFDLWAEEQKSDRLERKEELSGIREALNGMGQRVQDSRELVLGVRTVVMGVDGRNGLRSEVRSLHVQQAVLENRLTKAELLADEARRRLEAISDS